MMKAAARRAAQIASALVPGGMRFVRRIRRTACVVVMYHGVIERSLPVFNWCQLHREEFEQQIAFLSEEYSIIPLGELIERLAKRMPLPERTACITFDDGFKSVYETALPVLLKYKTPATVFLVTGLIGGTLPPWPELVYAALVQSDRTALVFESEEFPLTTEREKAVAIDKVLFRLKSISSDQKDSMLGEFIAQLAPNGVMPSDELAMLSWDEVENMINTGFMTFGSHTHNHPILSRCNEKEQAEELRKSRDVLLEHVGTADLFAYPNGRLCDYTLRTKQLLNAHGYRCALTTARGGVRYKSDLYELCRVGVGANLKFSDFEVDMLGF
jgi:peptidoglycan/xylan/chitin deacetylase (PgdA/CDA1 family)